MSRKSVVGKRLQMEQPMPEQRDLGDHDIFSECS